MIRRFEIEIAKDIGVNAAVILQNLATDEVCDSKKWICRSISEFCSIHPYIKRNSIKTALIDLEFHGYIISHKNGLNKTKSYKLTKKAWRVII